MTTQALTEDSLRPFVDTFERMRARIGEVIVGQEELVFGLLVALFGGGHVLVEGVPGLGKTLVARSLAQASGAAFKRIQFTPDLMPSDVTGSSIYDRQSGTFAFVPGPIFTNLLLADEVNRAPAKTQSALLEAMEERRVSLDGQEHGLGDLFMVCATQNPVESEGTYPLPEAQLDRFLLKVQVPYPTAQEEDELLRRFNAGFSPHDLDALGVRRLFAPEDIRRARRAVEAVRSEEGVLGYVRRLVHATRSSPSLRLGGGPRASIHLLMCAKAAAALRGRDFVTPDDVKFMAPPVLRHRLVLEPEVEIDGVTVEEVIQQLLASVEVPR